MSGPIVGLASIIQQYADVAPQRQYADAEESAQGPVTCIWP